jgi:hypothetical protein
MVELHEVYQLRPWPVLQEGMACRSGQKRELERDIGDDQVEFCNWNNGTASPFVWCHFAKARRFGRQLGEGPDQACDRPIPGIVAAPNSISAGPIYCIRLLSGLDRAFFRTHARFFLDIASAQSTGRPCFHELVGSRTGRGLPNIGAAKAGSQPGFDDFFARDGKSNLAPPCDSPAFAQNNKISSSTGEARPSSPL